MVFKGDINYPKENCSCVVPHEESEKFKYERIWRQSDKYIDDSEGVATLTLDDLNPVLTRMVDDDGEQQETLLHNEVCLLSGWHKVTSCFIISNLHSILIKESSIELLS